ncbi:MAG TPA: PEP/pyruvate-binding domain-containing protein [Pirellulales bacterium]|nr:PEP/pyruvate-binding domain-containing protein [Pirellulales bacterium]
MNAGDSTKQIVFFGCPGVDRTAVTAESVGSKAANLIRLAEEGVRVPPGFVLPVSFCRDYFDCGRRLVENFAELLTEQVERLGKATGLVYGGERRPLLLSVRSGAAVSMPGMLDTVLDVGLTDRTVSALVCLTGNPRHAWDSYRRLVQSYGEAVHGLAAEPFERRVDARLASDRVASPAELDAAALREIAEESLAWFSSQVGHAFPQNPREQLVAAVEAVFRSWQSARAVEFRRLRRLEHLPGTAVTIQTMVYGNLGGNSGSGVAFTRDPATGETGLYFDFLPGSQGEDIVGGRRGTRGSAALERILPEVYRELVRTAGRLEHLFGDVQDFEFTIQEGRLYVLQTRTAKRTPLAALRIACNLVAEGRIDETTALDRLSGYDLDELKSVRLAPPDGLRPLCRGTPAGSGVAIGPIALTPEAAATFAAKGQAPVLVRGDITTADIAGLASSAGIVTARGGRTSHAAVVARQLNKACVVGCRELIVPDGLQHCEIGDRSFAEGDWISADGQSGEVYAGRLDVRVEQPTAYLEQVKRWKAHFQSSLSSCGSVALSDSISP